MIFPLVFLVLVLLFVTSNAPVVKRSKVAKVVKEAFLPVYSYLTGSNDRLYSSIASMHSVFSDNDISYAITGDVLLSAVELERLSRGQSQATVLIPQEHVEKFLSLSNKFLEIGLGIDDLKDGGFRLSSAISMPFVGDTAVFVLPVINTGDRWITTTKYQNYNEWYGEKELFPGKTYKIGNLDIMGPLDPIPYLKRNFWSLGIHVKEIMKRRWFQVAPRFYGTNKIPVVRSPIIQTLPIEPVITDLDYVNGIMLDPRPLPRGTQKTIRLGNGTTAIVPNIGTNRAFPRRGVWRKYLWS